MNKTDWFGLILSMLIGVVVTSLVCVYLFHGLYKYRSLEDALEEVSQHPYDEFTYNCVNFSQDAVKQLQENNISSSIIIGYKEGETFNHAFIGVWIDPQTTEFVTEYNYIKTKTK